jgi:hypothetical protein
MASFFEGATYLLHSPAGSIRGAGFQSDSGESNHFTAFAVRMEFPFRFFPLSMTGFNLR